jgi:glycosyltransferase involved in cell wall biosynthesis
VSARAVQLVLVGLTATILIAPLVWKGARRRLDIFEPIVIFTAAYGVMFVVRPLDMILRGDFVFQAPLSVLDVRSTFTRMLVVALLGALGFVVGYLSPAGARLAAKTNRTGAPNLAVASYATGAVAVVAIASLALFLVHTGGSNGLSLLFRGRTDRLTNDMGDLSFYPWTATLMLVPAALAHSLDFHDRPCDRHLPCCVEKNLATHLSEGCGRRVIRVVYWNNIPSQYMVDRFNAVARRGNLEFEAWFSSRTESDRSWEVDESSWLFPHRYVPVFGRGRFALAFPTPLFRGRPPDVFLSLYTAPGFLLGSSLARRRGARTAFWSEVTYDSWVQRRRWKEWLKSRLFPWADAVLTAGDDGRSFARRYGARADHIYEVPHVIDYEHYAGNLPTPAERDAFRAAIGARGVTFAYVGRLWSGKGLTFLLEAFVELQELDVGEVTLLLVGDGLDEALLRERCKAKGLENVVFAGFQHDDVLPRFYGASDVFVFPTLGNPFGIVVLEAMACGLPVIASTSAGEIADRVVDGVNGFLVPPANREELLDRMTLLTRDAELRRRMGKASVEKVEGQAPDMWAEAFEQAVEKIVSMPRVSDSRPDRIPRMRRTAGGRTK